jgi:nucleoside-diphosphate-sugar epimerase
MATPRTIVTGGTGKVGRAVSQHRVDGGYDVVNVDASVPGQPACRCLTADLTGLGPVIDAFSPHSTGNRAPYLGILHITAIPRPRAPRLELGASAPVPV